MTTMLEKRSVLSLLVLGACVATLPRISVARELETPPLTVDEVIAIGRAAPSLRLAEMLQAPEGFDPSWEALKGRVVVLEFWATWCAPCIPALDHLGELQGKLSDVLVLGISPEDPGRMFLPILFVAQLWKTAQGIAFISALVLLLLWISAAVYAVIHPNRGLHDRLAGTWVVRR